MAAGADRRAGPTLGRTAILLLLALSLRARAGTTAPAFDEALATSVFTSAFTFMTPRTLDPVSVPRMTLWGMRGITALDPNLIPQLHEQQAALIGPNRILASFALPRPEDVAGWSSLNAQMIGAAWHYSEALRRAGTEGVIASFFDEVFNHLDPYSRYVPPDAAAEDRAVRHGAAGIGVTLTGLPGEIVVGNVVPSGPAVGAGVRAGDRIVAVDGTPNGRDDAAVVLGRLNGDEGSTVVITLRMRGRTRKLTLTRALVAEDAVTATQLGSFLVLRIGGFTSITTDRLQRALGVAMDRRPQPGGVVLDLRGNRGGLLHQAVDIADLVMTGGLIVSTDGRNPQARHRWVAAGGDLADGLPIVVLVDGSSASAAEVLAAALSDDGRAVVVGSSTLGKGLVQTVGTMPDGGELFVTWSRVLAPAGWPLQGLGVMPQVCTSLGAAQTQYQLDALAAGRQTMRAVLATHRAARPNLPLAEMLAIRNACPAALGSDTDLLAARFLLANPVAYAMALAPAG